MKLKCPRCGNFLDSGAAAPGSAMTCSCGNVMTVPKTSGKFPIWVVFLIAGVFGCLPCTGILAAIAIPNFVRFQARAKQTECKANLKAFYVAARAELEGEGRATEDLSKLWKPDRGNLYAYFTSLEGTMEEPGQEVAGPISGVLVDTARHPKEGITVAAVARVASGVHPGLSGTCPGHDCAVTLLCAGNIDSDDTLDIWSISTGERTTTEGKTIPAGEPFHHLDDLTN